MYNEFMQKGSVVALGGKEPPALFTGDVKDEAFRNTGIEVVKLDFASIMHMSPEAFFEEILFKTLHVAGVCCGFNYTFGDKGRGTPEMLDRMCAEKGVVFEAADATVLDGTPVSSTRIRNALAGGNVELANRMLGRPFQYRQQVVDGDKRGRTWGIPTINQPYPEELVVPRHGVYASRCVVDGRTYFGATNIGVRPTVREARPTSSTTRETSTENTSMSACSSSFVRRRNSTPSRRSKSRSTPISRPFGRSANSMCSADRFFLYN